MRRGRVQCKCLAGRSCRGTSVTPRTTARCRIGRARKRGEPGRCRVREDNVTARHGRRTWWAPALAVLIALVAGMSLLATDGAPLAQTLGRVSAAPPGGAAPAPAAPPDTPEPPPVESGLAQAAVNAAQEQAASATQLGVAVLARATGELAPGDRGHERFYTASLAKLIVIVDVLDRRRSEGLKVTDGDLALFRRALALSDDSAMNALWERFDGAAAVTRVSKRLGLEATRAPRVVGQWGQVEVTA